MEKYGIADTNDQHGWTEDEKILYEINTLRGECKEAIDGEDATSYWLMVKAREVVKKISDLRVKKGLDEPKTKSPILDFIRGDALLGEIFFGVSLDGVQVGFLRKFKNTRTEKHPWQYHELRTAGDPHDGNWVAWSRYDLKTEKAAKDAVTDYVSMTTRSKACVSRP